MHRDSESCPFEGDFYPTGAQGTCCSFHGSTASLYMVAMGLATLVTSLYTDKEPADALDYAKRIRAALRETRTSFSELRSNTGASTPLEIMISVWGVDCRFPLGQAIATLEALAHWHERVAGMGFGVRTEF